MRKFGCTKVFRQQTTQAIARDAIKWKVLTKRTALKELYVAGTFAEDRKTCREQLHRHCEHAYDDEVVTAEKQEEKIIKFNTAAWRFLWGWELLNIQLPRWSFRKKRFR